MQLQLEIDIKMTLHRFGLGHGPGKVDVQQSGDLISLSVLRWNRTVTGKLYADYLHFRDRNRVVVAMCLELLMLDLAEGIYG